MTRDEARAGLLTHAIHTVEDFMRERDKQHEAAHPGYEMGSGWADGEALWSDFIEFQRAELKRLKL